MAALSIVTTGLDVSRSTRRMREPVTTMVSNFSLLPWSGAAL